MASDASKELDTMVSDASKKFEAAQEPETPAVRRRGRRMMRKRKKVCRKCESIGKKG